MNKKLISAISVVAAILAISAGIGTASVKASDLNNVNRPMANYQTASTNNTVNDTNTRYCEGSGGMMGNGMGAQVTSQVANLLGTTVSDLEAQLNSGKTLANIATAKGISQDKLIQTIIAPYIAHLDTMVKYGHLTQDQENNLVQQAQQRLQTLVTSPSNSNSDWLDDMGGMMYGSGNSQQQSATHMVPQTGFGNMMGGSSGGGMMGGR